MPKAVIVGYYGFGNTGDEAVLAAMTASLREADPSLELAVLTADPAGSHPVPGLAVANRWRPLQVLDALHRADILISGGGTLLQDATSLRSLAYYVGLILLARFMGKKVVIYGNGFGPLRSHLGRFLAGEALEAAHLITLRDSRSHAEVTARYPHLADRTSLTADPAFLLPPASSDRARQLLATAGLAPGAPFLAVCVRHWKGFDLTAPLAAALDGAAAAGVTPLFLPMQVPGDTEASRRVQAAMTQPSLILEERVAPAEFAAMLAEARAVVAMRLHAAILAAAAGVPSLGLVYDPKVEGVLADLGLPTVGSATQPDPAGIAPALMDLLARRDELAARVRERGAAAREAARANTRLALSALQSDYL